MSETGKQFTGRVPEFYDKGLVPIIFEDYAAEMATRVAALEPAVVLELASGTGAVTQVLRATLPPECEIIASDLNDPMMDVARSKFPDDTSVSFRVVDAMDIPMADATIDVIACQFGVMFFPDKPASYGEALRVLKPGGTYLFNLWDSHAANPFARLGQQLCEEMYPDNPPGFYKVPFHYHNVSEIEDAVKHAGFSSVIVERRAIEKTVPSFKGFAEAFVYGNPLGAEIEAMGKDPAEMVGTLVEVWQAEFGGPPTTMPLSALFVTAVK